MTNHGSFTLLIVAALSALYSEINAQCSGAGEIITFEKVTGMIPRGVNPTPMFGRGSRGEVDDEPVTVQCSALCRNSQSCAAFLVRYGDGTCHSLTVDKLTDDLVTSHDKVNYFEKVCLPPVIGCERSWQYERVPGRELAGYDDKIIPNVLDRRLCQVLCTQERTFICRSGEYDYTLQQCRLSSEHRRSQPSAFRPAPSDVDYFENLCAPGPSAGCEYEELEGVDLGRADLLRSAFSASQCRALCDAARPFLCRSASFWAGSGQCWLSGDDTSSAGARSLGTRPGVFFYQRSNCLKVQLACNADSMTLTLNTLEPFVGRIFAKTQANLCNVEGKGQKSTSLIMPLKPTEVCGVQMESSGRYRNAVIVQHHPVIQRKGDRILQLLCVFETANRTVTSDYRVVIGDFSSATAIVNATAPSPNIRLRITDKNGDDITGTRLGEELYLRIEIDDDSVFGIAARDLIARSGKTDDYITLIDSNGCPTDPAIFPALQRVPGGKALQGRFDAFKFADDVVVRFEVNVQFCLQTCDPVACVNGGPSFGKRRRSVMEDSMKTELTKDNTTETPLLPDYSLQREIIVEGISVTPIKDTSIDRSAVTNYEEGLLCTSKPVIIGTVVVAVLVQLIIIVACGVCVFIARKKRKEDEMDDGTLSTMTRMTSPFGNFSSDYRGTMRSLRRLD